MTPSLRAKLLLAIALFACIVAACKHQPADSRSLDQRLLAAADNGDDDTILQLLKQGAHIGAKGPNGETALIYAARRGDSHLMKLLLAWNPALKDKTDALFWAAESGPVVIQIVQDVPTQNPPPKPIVLNDDLRFMNYAGVVKLLHDSGVPIEARDEQGDTPLIRAASFGQTEVVQFLLDRGAKVDARSKDGSTALIGAACECALATMRSTEPTMKLLLEKGAGIEAQSDDGTTPLMAATTGFGQLENIPFLLNKGAKVDAKDKHGNTALLLSVSGFATESIDATRVLLDHGANIEARDSDGNTPLMFAVSKDSSGQLEIVKLLLSRGANPRTKNNQGDTALTLATKTGHTNAIPLLKKAKL